MIRKYFQLVIKGIPWSIFFSVGFFIFEYYLLKNKSTITEMLIGSSCFVLFGGPTFILLRDKLISNKNSK